ncbi:hypothetical protein NEH83_31820 [Streptomyces sp. JUS-F4]|uniref:hypothetical protein n=1 Tax=Streptomyces TaxID=1883 RepID=UPI000A3BE4CA|nr:MULTISPECIES: hypothetical protein [Streptomyces]QXR00424.1 hypothetical protein KV381_31645 [Streptomyces sp. WY228]WKN18371.1 hypothetical protein NEH83_31820 [Streptomyces sp. JUS-F4]
MTNGPWIAWSSPPKLAEIARSTGVARACSHGSTGTPVSASRSAMPERNAEDPVHVARSWIPRSSWNSGRTSSRRVAEVTLWTTRSTRRQRTRVAQRAASSPTGTRIHWS